VKKNLQQGVIKSNMSPCSSLIIMDPMKDRSWRICIDYRALNKVTIKNKYPLPLIDDLLDQLQHAKLFTKLDLKSGYYQVRIKAEDVWNTTFKMKQGLYE